MMTTEPLEFKLIAMAQQTDPSGTTFYLLRYEKPDGTYQDHAMPSWSLETWMAETDFAGTPKQALPLMLNRMLEQLTPDGVEGPRAILPKDSNHPVHKMHKSVDLVRVSRLKAEYRKREADAREHRSPVGFPGVGPGQHGAHGRTGPSRPGDAAGPGQ